MELEKVFVLLVVGLMVIINDSVIGAPNPQEPIFEVPVQLVGFPVIIAAVRITNFVKKLAYSLNPETYQSRVKRSNEGLKKHEDNAETEDLLDAAEVEKRLVKELGENVCVYERICSSYATKSFSRRNREQVLDTGEIFRYKASPDPMKENYLLSVFLGDIVASPRLCRQLAKRGRACDENTLSE